MSSICINITLTGNIIYKLIHLINKAFALDLETFTDKIDSIIILSMNTGKNREINILFTLLTVMASAIVKFLIFFITSTCESIFYTSLLISKV